MRIPLKQKHVPQNIEEWHKQFVWWARLVNDELAVFETVWERVHVISEGNWAGGYVATTLYAPIESTFADLKKIDSRARVLFGALHDMKSTPPPSRHD